MGKIRNIKANFTRDMVNLADTYLPVTFCPGERPVMQGRICVHCGHDYTTDGDCKGVVGFVKREALEAQDNA